MIHFHQFPPYQRNSDPLTTYRRVAFLSSIIPQIQYVSSFPFPHPSLSHQHTTTTTAEEARRSIERITNPTTVYSMHDDTSAWVQAFLQPKTVDCPLATEERGFCMISPAFFPPLLFHLLTYGRAGKRYREVARILSYIGNNKPHSYRLASSIFHNRAMCIVRLVVSGCGCLKKKTSIFNDGKSKSSSSKPSPFLHVIFTQKPSSSPSLPTFITVAS